LKEEQDVIRTQDVAQGMAQGEAHGINKLEEAILAIRNSVKPPF